MQMFRPTTLFTSLLAGASLATAPIAAHAQLTGQNKSPDSGPPTISVTTQLVIEDVSVKDKNGKTITGLTKNDFVLTEDGTVQTLSYAEYQHLPEDATPLPPQAPGTEDIKIYNRLARTQIATETPGEVRYKDKRLLAFYFDMSAMPNTADQMRALAAAEKFVRQSMTTADLVAVLRYQGSSVDTLIDFTDDRNKILSILETMVVGEGQGDTDVTNDSSAADTGAAFGQDSGEFNIFTTDRQLSALQTAAESLAHLSEKKILIYFAAGLNLNGLDNQAQLMACTDAAIKAGVVLWSIDARGLIATPPMGDASHGSPGGQAMYTGGSIMAGISGLQRSQDTLYTLATDTGGKAFLDNNDLTQGIIQAQKSVSDYYILGYYTSNHALDGKFRKIKVTLANNTEAKLDFRQGYYAGKTWGNFNGADKERQLEDALMQGDPVTELTIGLELNYFQLNRAEYFLPVMMKIPGSELALAKKRGAQVANLDFIGEIKDIYGGTTVNNIRDHVSFKLNDETAEQWTGVPIKYYSGYTELPGTFTIKVLARDDATGHIGTFQTTFTIPNLNKVTNRVAISSVVLSGEKQTPSSAVYTAAKGKDAAKQIAADPLVQNGLQMIPSVTRVFTKTRPLYVFLQAYQQAEMPTASTADTPPTKPAGSTTLLSAGTVIASSAQPLIGFVTLYQGGKKVFETQPEEVTPDTASRLNTSVFNFAVDVSRLQTGKYDCQVTILEPTGKKAAFWQTPIMLVE